LATEVESGALIINFRRRFRRIDLHSAYGIVRFNWLHGLIVDMFAQLDLYLSAQSLAIAKWDAGFGAEVASGPAH
jgi:hypothetical protein